MKHTNIKLLLIMALIIGTMSCVTAEVTIEEVDTFLKNDLTNTHDYVAWYTCGHFARDLARNASDYNISIGSAICGNHPIFRGSQNHIINYADVNGTLYFIEPQTDSIFLLDDVFLEYKYIRLYPDGTQVPSNWKCNLAYDLKYIDYNLFQ